ncbi:MAG TPA: hypothetical protein VNH19_08520 [Candidatus Limnocylindrales bacterium]|nr:hypothetical protein [Candidatus Limnocylindrales bacterium]
MELPEGGIFDSMTISQEVGGVTTWDLCANCSKALAEQCEKDMAITRGRWNEQFMKKMAEEVG